MKYIYLMRHAHALPASGSEHDFSRSLSVRGQKEGLNIAFELNNKEVKFDYVISSPAVRACQTVKIVCENQKFDLQKVIYQQDLYESTHELLLNYIGKIDNKHVTALLVAHDPTLSELVQILLGYQVTLSAGALVGFEILSDDWADFALKNRQILFLSSK